LPLLLDHPLHQGLAAVALLGVGREKEHADGILSRRREGNAHRLTLAGEELVGCLNDEASPITSVGIAPTGAPVGQVEEDLQALLEDPVGPLPGDVGDDANPTAGVLVLRVVEPFLNRDEPRFH